MCGIVGIIGSQSDEWIHVMNDMNVHRGPDDVGVFRDRDASFAMAMRRLSVIDLTDGHQPMSTEDGRFSIVFNGEIFNAAALRRELENKGTRFVTDHSDTEVLLRLLVKEGRAALPRLNGMFAFALWDRCRQELFCARDRFGIKPFFYTSQQGRVAFASELKSILTLPWVVRSVDRRSLYHFMSLIFTREGHSYLRHFPVTCWRLDDGEG